MRLIYSLITKDNLDEAIKAQKDIFPDEDYTSVYTKKNLPYISAKDYYLVYDEEKLVGITGLYSYIEYPDDVWLGWFGVMSNCRNQGYGEQILRDTIKIAQNRGFTYIRLYTDSEQHKEACELYKKLHFIKENYTRENLKFDIYSLQVKTLHYFNLWNNQMLYLDKLTEIIEKKKSIPRRPKVFMKG